VLVGHAGRAAHACYPPAVTRLRLATAGHPLQTFHGAAIALCLVAVTACGAPSNSSSPNVSAEPGQSAAGTPATGSPSSSDEPALSPSPADSPTASAVAASSASPWQSGHPATECTGSDENRDFFADIAASVNWTVYCPVLPDGWVVDTGSYRLANGGKLDIAYRNRSGARLELHEGAFCGDTSSCAPAGSASGDVAFADRTGTLIAAGDGSWAVSVDGGEGLAWLAVGRGMDESTFRAAAAALLAVGG
jgi:hypothetical protein